MICPACQKDVTPFAELERGGTIRRCSNLDCRAVIRDAPAAAVAAPLAVPAVSHRAPAKPRAMILQPPVTVQPVVVDAEHAAAAPLTAADMVVTMRERLSAVKARLGELAQLKAEEALLERMLAAAEPPPN